MNTNISTGHKGMTLKQMAAKQFFDALDEYDKACAKLKNCTEKEEAEARKQFVSASICVHAARRNTMDIKATNSVYNKYFGKNTCS